MYIHVHSCTFITSECSSEVRPPAKFARARTRQFEMTKIPSTKKKALNVRPPKCGPNCSSLMQYVMSSFLRASTHQNFRPAVAVGTASPANCSSRHRELKTRQFSIINLDRLFRGRLQIAPTVGHAARLLSRGRVQIAPTVGHAARLLSRGRVQIAPTVGHAARPQALVPKRQACA